MAASSTWAVAARNLGLAFMGASFGGITRIRFKGTLSPVRPDRTPASVQRYGKHPAVTTKVLLRLDTTSGRLYITDRSVINILCLPEPNQSRAGRAAKTPVRRKS